jgi:hypothetical protein
MKKLASLLLVIAVLGVFGCSSAKVETPAAPAEGAPAAEAAPAAEMAPTGAEQAK